MRCYLQLGQPPFGEHYSLQRDHFSMRQWAIGIVLMVAQPAFGQADALVTAKSQYAQAWQSCQAAQREQSTNLLRAQAYITKYTNQYQGILQRLPDFTQQVGAPIKAQIALCQNVGNTIRQDLANTSMDRALKICESVDTAFATNNLVQAEALLQRFDQQKLRVSKLYPGVLSDAKIQSGLAQCEARHERAMHWRQLIDHTGNLIRNKAQCDSLFQKLKSETSLTEALRERARQEVNSARGVLERAENQVQPFLSKSAYFPPNSVASYNNGVSSVAACIAAVSAKLAPKPVPTKPAKPKTDPQAVSLVRRCREVVGSGDKYSGNMASVTPEGFETFEQAKASWFEAYKQFTLSKGKQFKESLHAKQGKQNALARCAETLEIIFVALEAALLEKTQPQGRSTQVAQPVAPVQNQASEEDPPPRRKRGLWFWKSEKADSQ